MLDMLSHGPFFFRWETALAQMVGFLVFFLVLKFFLFDRLLGFMKHRNGDLALLERRVGETRKEIERLSTEIDAKLAAADKAAYEEMQGIVKEGLAAKAAVLQAAQDRGRQIVDEARRAVAAEKEQALRALDAEVVALASEVASTATGGAAPPGEF